jgi:hypothetical protein
MTYGFLAFKLRLALDAPARRNTNELVHLSYLCSGDLPALVDVEFRRRSAFDFCASSSQSSAQDQSRSRDLMFFLLERLDRGGGNALSALARHNYERNLAGLLVRRQRCVHFSPPNLQPRLADILSFAIRCSRVEEKTAATLESVLPTAKAESNRWRQLSKHSLLTSY